jgi:hypothetical protein
MPLYDRHQETRARVAIIREEVAVGEHAAGAVSAVAVLEPTTEGIRGMSYVTSDAPFVLPHRRNLTIFGNESESICHF